jgi:organic radical activating enzyme
MPSIFEAGQKALAVRSLKKQLRTDPSNVEIRAKLGELQYRPPATPVTHRSRAEVPIRVAEVTIEVRNPCNYRCHYCVAAGQNNEPVKHFDLPAINKSLGLIKAELIVFSLDCGGGEPTVHPQFPELIQLLSSYGPVSFPSNNSQKPERWLPREFAKRLTIRSAIHPEAEEKFDRYIANARYLTEAGCNFCALYIAHPERISKVAAYRERCVSEGIPFFPVAFLGEHNGKRYPNSYTAEERELIGLNQESRYWYHKLEPHATRIRNFRGIPCIAGYRNMFIGRDGSVRRCLYDKRKLDAPLEKPEPCGVKHCGCGLMLAELNSTEAHDFYNNWGPAAGYEPINLSSLLKMATPEGLNEDLFHEGIAIYDELMRAYAKDEIPES